MKPRFLSRLHRPSLGQLTFSLVFLFAMAYLYLHLFVLPSTPRFTGIDEGLFLSSATRILNGQIIYRDFFELYFPGTDYFYALLIDLFGPRAWIPNACLMFLGAVFLCASVMISRSLIRGISVLLPGLLFLRTAFIFYRDAVPHWYGNFLIILAIALVAQARFATRISAAGLLVGLATCFTQQHGALAALGFGGFICWEGIRDAHPAYEILRKELYFFFPFLGVVGICTALMVSKAGVAPFFRSTLLFPIKYWGSTNSWSGNLYASIAQSLREHRYHLLSALTFAVLIPGIYVLAVLRYLYRRSEAPLSEWRTIGLISVVGLATFVSIANVPTAFRMATVSLPAFIVLVWLVQRKTKVVCLLWIFIGFMMFKDLAVSRTYHFGYVDSPSGQIAVPTGILPFFKWMTRNTHPGEYVFDAVGWRSYYWFELQNPTKLWWLTSCEFTRPEQVSEALQDLREHRTDLIIWSAGSFDTSCPPTSDHTGPLSDYLHSHYRRIKTFQRWRTAIWERTSPERSQLK